MRVTDFLPKDWEHQPVSYDLPACFKPNFAEAWKTAVDVTSEFTQTHKEHWLSAIDSFLYSCYSNNNDPFVDPAETVNDRIYNQILTTYRAAKDWLRGAQDLNCVVNSANSEIVLTVTARRQYEPNEWLELTKTWEAVGEYRVFNGSGYTIRSYVDHPLDNGIESVYNFDVSIVIKDWPVLEFNGLPSESDVQAFIVELYKLVKRISP